MSRLSSLEYPYNLINDIIIIPRFCQRSDDYITILRTSQPEDFEGSIEYVLCTLKPQEREVIRLRYHEKKIYREIHDELGLSIERIRQIQNKVLRKLHHPSKWKYIEYGVKGAEERALNELRESFSNNSSNEPNNGKTILLEDLELSIRSYNCLARVGVRTADDIIALGERLYMVRNLGRRSIEEVLDKLKQHGIDCTALEQKKPL